MLSFMCKSVRCHTPSVSWWMPAEGWGRVWKEWEKSYEVLAHKWRKLSRKPKGRKERTVQTQYSLHFTGLKEYTIFINMQDSLDTSWFYMKPLLIRKVMVEYSIGPFSDAASQGSATLTGNSFHTRLHAWAHRHPWMAGVAVIDRGQWVCHTCLESTLSFALFCCLLFFPALFAGVSWRFNHDKLKYNWMHMHEKHTYKEKHTLLLFLFSSLNLLAACTLSLSYLRGFSLWLLWLLLRCSSFLPQILQNHAVYVNWPLKCPYSRCKCDCKGWGAKLRTFLNVM